MLIFTFICLIIQYPVNYSDLTSRFLTNHPCPSEALYHPVSLHSLYLPLRIMSDPLTEAHILAMVQKLHEKVEAVFENDSKTLQKELLESTMQAVSQKLRSATESLMQKQILLEQKTASRIESLNKQIASLLALFQQSSPSPPATPGLAPDSVCVSSATLDSDCESCDNFSQSNHSGRMHEFEEHIMSSFYTCTLCESVFHSFSELSQHFENDHAITNIDACSICEQVFLNSTEVGYHVAAMHGNQASSSAYPISSNRDVDQHNCVSCQEMFTCKRDLDLHTTLHHNNDGLLFLQPSNLCTEIPLSNHSPVSSASPSTISNHLNCMYCGHTSETESQLKEHIYQIHGSVSLQNWQDDESVTSNNDMTVHNQNMNDYQAVYLECDICSLTFLSQDLLTKHAQSHHVSMARELHCNMCEKTFSDMVDLNAHTQQDHTQELLSVSTTPLDNESTIPQCDGVFDIVEEENAHANLELQAHHRVAPYILNKTKQLNNLSKDATKHDFEIEITHETNVNVQCSTGFFLAVAKPAFSNLSKGYKAVVSGVGLTCEDTRCQGDRLGRDVNWVFWFKVALNGPNSSLSSATVHIHNTQRLIQVQGGAAIWFVENALKERFINESKNKKVDIAVINKTFNLMSKKLLESGTRNSSCPICNQKFKSNSKTTLCQSCKLSFHNTKQYPCMKAHKCTQGIVDPHLAPPPGVSTLTPSQSTPVLSAHGASVTPSQTSLSSLVTSSPNPTPITAVVDAESRPTNSSNNLTPSTSYQTSSVSTLRLLTQSTSTILTISPASTASVIGQSSAVSTISSPSLVTPRTSSQLNTDTSSLQNQSTSRNKTSSRRNNLSENTKTVKDTEITFLKQEILIVKTKLAQTEADNRDLERKNKILSEAIRIHETEQNDTMRREFLPELNPKVKSVPSSSSMSSLTLGTCSGYTIDRLIKYFLDVIEGNPVLESCKSRSSTNEQPTTNVTRLPMNGSPNQVPSTDSTSTSQPSSDYIAQTSAEEIEHAEVDVSMGTIDDFSGVIHSEADPLPPPQKSQNLNSSELTIQ